ncbi:MAG: CDP-diacylglycerol--glycerol-3-phosphate 3-phosphatidyltransferase [Clostridiales bacterium]|jgi:CDP-diacylglycerol--glycerol-3-phosphate 3-phosphatidyltransferase|nr:CDP-diacylglycerol--glycerol-3-phosphate 3-phosphatidyltransferase [Clostridiales bacterium]
MNLPNKLTIGRIAMIPLFILALHGADFGWYDLPTARLIAVGIFALAAFTDFLDGYIARKHGLITDFGKFMDPLADKILVMAAMVYLLWLGEISPWVLIIVEGREFVIAGLRMLASQKGIVIAAGFWGKIKTITQMVMILVVLPGFDHPIAFWGGQVLIYACVALTLISAADYIYHNRNAFNNKEKADE